MPRGGRRLSKHEMDAVLRRLFGKPAKPWTGEVIRRDPEKVRQQSEIMIRRCTNPHCRSWTPVRLPYCTACHTDQ